MANWINTIADALDKAFMGARKALPVVPPLLLICGAINRPGMSAINLTANIIKRFPEIGAYSGTLPDGSRNVMEGLVRIMAEEFLREKRKNERVTIGFKPGDITFVGTGANAGGPVTVTGANINVAVGHGYSS